MRKRLGVLLPLVAVVVIGASSAVANAPGPAALTNPGFEADGSGVGSPSGWSTSGTKSADFTEAGGHSGGFRLTHWSQSRYEVETSQTVRGLEKGSYTLRAWVRRSTGKSKSFIALDGCGGGDARVNLPVSTGEWLQIVVSQRVSRRSCTIVLHSKADGGEWTNFDDVELVPGSARLSILGGDVSSLKKSEDYGGVYRDESGAAGDALAILEDEGLSWIRQRVWVNPADGYHDKDELLTMASRAKALGLSVLVNLHYSDRWADPGHQLKPAAWSALTFPQLTQAVYDHTFDVCSSLVAQGTPPQMIQLGNELNSGMLWPDGHTWNPPNWDNLAELLKAGHAAVKACSPATRVMLHLANGGDNGLYRWWFDNITSRGVPFDVIGLSFYEYWHGTLGALQRNMNDVAARYGKDLVLVETAYPFTLADDDGWENIIDLESELVPGYPATPAGQAANFRDVMSIVRAVPGGRGLGVFYWDPTWTGVIGNGWDPEDPSSGNAWENQALFDFDGRPTPAMDEFQR